MKIALFTPYFTYPGGKFPNWFEYWQKSASYNSEIDFFVHTNVDISQYKKYRNVHLISMSSEEFWDKLDSILGIKVYRGYYKTGEYRALCGILFKDIIKDYDYWGSTELDLIYGDIMKFIKPYIDRGDDVIGKDGHLRLIKNTDALRYLPFEKARGFEHPLNYETAFSTEYCWYFDEGGMNLRYQQAGIDVTLIDEHFAHVHELYKYFLCVGKEGKWGFSWQKGKLKGYNDANQSREFMYMHFTKRKMSLSDDKLPGDEFCVVPNIIINNCKRNDKITPGSTTYTLKKKFDRFKKYFRKLRILSSDDMLILLDSSLGPKRLRKIAYRLKKLTGK